MPLSQSQKVVEGLWLSYFTATNPNKEWTDSVRVSLFLFWRQSRIYSTIKIGPSCPACVSTHTVKPFSHNSEDNMQKNNSKKSSVSQALFTLSEGTHRMRREHDPWKNPPWSSPSISSHCAPHWAFLNLRNELLLVQRWVSSVFVDVLMPDDLVGDPVEDVEDEEGQREGSPGDGVYPLGSIHKLLLHGVYVPGGGWLRVGSGSSVLNSWAVVLWQTLTHVVASKSEAAFADFIILKDT